MWIPWLSCLMGHRCWSWGTCVKLEFLGTQPGDRFWGAPFSVNAACWWLLTDAMEPQTWCEQTRMEEHSEKRWQMKHDETEINKGHQLFDKCLLVKGMTTSQLFSTSATLRGDDLLRLRHSLSIWILSSHLEQPQDRCWMVSCLWVDRTICLHDTHGRTCRHPQTSLERAGCCTLLCKLAFATRRSKVTVYVHPVLEQCSPKLLNYCKKKETLLVQKGAMSHHVSSIFQHFPPVQLPWHPQLGLLDAKHLSSESDGSPCHSHAAAEEPLSNHRHVGQALGRQVISNLSHEHAKKRNDIHIT